MDNYHRKRILITGGAGFLGSHLCERLLKEGNEILCLDNFFTGTKENIIHLMDDHNFEVIRHDVEFPIHLEVDEIYNLAAMRVSCTNPEKEVMVVDPKYFRPSEVDTLFGNATKANTKLSWVPEFDLEDLVREMVQADLKHMLRDKYLKGEGFETFNYFE